MKCAVNYVLHIYETSSKVYYAAKLLWNWIVLIYVHEVLSCALVKIWWLSDCCWLFSFILFITAILQMWSTSFNPFTWDKTRQRVTTNVASLDVRNAEEDLLTISGLSPGVTFEVPQQKPFSRYTRIMSSAKLGVKLHHNISVQYGHSRIQITISPDDDSIIAPYLRVSQPKVISPQNRLLECKRSQEQWLPTGNITCEGTTNVTITFFTIYPGSYHLETKFAAHPNSAKDNIEENQDRKQRNKIKAPPKSETENMTYRFAFTEVACLFWDSDMSNWKTTGCKVNKYPCHLIVCYQLIWSHIE